MFFFAILYRVLYKLHHLLCLRPGSALQKSRLVVVGSYRIGGAGKTPVTIEFAKRYVAEGKSVAILLHSAAKDEELLIQRNVDKRVGVFRTGNRYRTSLELDGKYDMILCDDGFEDSRLRPNETILLDWGDPCSRIRDLWPCGKCRSLDKDHRGITKVLKCGRDVRFFVEKIVPLETLRNNNSAQFQTLSSPLAIVCGLGDPNRFFEDVECYLKLQEPAFTILEKIARPDHDKNFDSALRSLLAKNLGTSFIISEKDACRVKAANVNSARNRIFVAIQRTQLFI